MKPAYAKASAFAICLSLKFDHSLKGVACEALRVLFTTNTPI